MCESVSSLKKIGKLVTIGRGMKVWLSLNGLGKKLKLA